MSSDSLSLQVQVLSWLLSDDFLLWAQTPALATNSFCNKNGRLQRYLVEISIFSNICPVCGRGMGGGVSGRKGGGACYLKIERGYPRTKRWGGTRARRVSVGNGAG